MLWIGDTLPHAYFKSTEQVTESGHGERYCAQTISISVSTEQSRPVWPENVLHTVRCAYMHKLRQRSWPQEVWRMAEKCHREWSGWTHFLSEEQLQQPQHQRAPVELRRRLPRLQRVLYPLSYSICCMPTQNDQLCIVLSFFVFMGLYIQHFNTLFLASFQSQRLVLYISTIRLYCPSLIWLSSLGYLACKIVPGMTYYNHCYSPLLVVHKTTKMKHLN